MTNDRPRKSKPALIAAVALGFALPACAKLPDAQAASDVVLMIQGYGRWAWAVGIALIWADLLLPIPQTVVIAALGIIYGTLLGGLLGTVGLITGGLIGYALMRTSLRRLAQRFVKPRSLRRAEDLFDRSGTWAIILTRGLPYSIPEAVVLFAGLARMPAAKFAVAMSLGSVPAGFVFAAIGSGWAHEPIAALALSYVLPIVLLPVAMYALRTRKL